MNVLSLFDGMSCGQIALNRAGIKYDKYFASEIDKNAIKVTQHNYPDTIQLGDIIKLDTSSLPKIDLLMGGFCCQSFSFCGNQLNFNDPRGKLFFEYVRIKNELQPKYFLAENVKMRREYQDIISKALGVDPIEINSSLVSAQYRKRLYWTNISFHKMKDKGIYLKDIMISNYSSETPCRNQPLRIKTIKGGGQGDRIYAPEGKGISLVASSGGTAGNGNMLVEDTYGYRKLNIYECERLQTVPEYYTEVDGVSLNQRHKMLGNGWTVDVIAHILQGIKN